MLGESHIVGLAEAVARAESLRSRKVALAAEQFLAEPCGDTAVELLMTSKLAEGTYLSTLRREGNRLIEAASGRTAEELAEMDPREIMEALDEESDPETTPVGDREIPGIDMESLGGESDG